MHSSRSLLIVTSVIAGLAELGMAVQFAASDDPGDGPLPAIVFGLLFLGFTWALGSTRVWPAIPLALLFAIEVAFVPFYERDGLADWLEQGGFAIVSVIGLVASIAVIASRRPVPA